MNALVAAYLMVWIATVLFMSRIGVRQQRLAGRLVELERKLDEQQAVGAFTERGACQDNCRAA